jgi:uncharacterized membrane protein
METIRNPIEWAADQLHDSARHVKAMSRSLVRGGAAGQSARPGIRRIAVADLRNALARGVDDFKACRTDIVFICVIYPLAGLLLVRLAVVHDMLPLVFPLASGFALVGPVLAVVLYEMSRRRERGLEATWVDAFGVIRSPSIGAIVVLGLLLLAMFVAWLLVAQAIYAATLGPEPPESVATFARDVVTTGSGWTMIGVGVGVGFLFAAAVLAVSVVSFPMLLDREVGVRIAVLTSIRAVRANPVTMAVWGLVVAAGLVIGTLPMLLGLIVVFPVLGHATWHLYRKLVVHP